MSKLTDQIPMEQKIARQFRLWEQTHRDVSIGAEQAVQPCITISQSRRMDAVYSRR